MKGATIKREGEEVVIRIPVQEVLGLRVALAPCPCKATKSFATADIRSRLERGLSRAVFPRPTERKKV